MFAVGEASWSTWPSWEGEAQARPTPVFLAQTGVPEARQTPPRSSGHLVGQAGLFMYPAPSTTAQPSLPPSEWPVEGKPGEPQGRPPPVPSLPSSSLGFGCPWRQVLFIDLLSQSGPVSLLGVRLGGGLALSSALDSGKCRASCPREEGEKETASFLVKKGTFFVLSRQDPTLTLGVQRVKPSGGGGNW